MTNEEEMLQSSLEAFTFLKILSNLGGVPPNPSCPSLNLSYVEINRDCV